MCMDDMALIATGRKKAGRDAKLSCYKGRPPNAMRIESLELSRDIYVAHGWELEQTSPWPSLLRYILTSYSPELSRANTPL